MSVRTYFIFFNYMLAFLALLCLVFAEVFHPFLGGVLILGLATLALLEARQQIPLLPPARFSLFKISIILLPALYFGFNPGIPELLCGFLVFALFTRFLYKTELNDYLYGHLIAIVCLLVGALFIQDMAFAFLFLGFYLVLSWALIFYNLMAERLGSRCPPEVFRHEGRRQKPETALFGWTGTMMLASLILTAGIFIAFPRLGLGFFALDNGGTPISGFSDRVRLGDVGKIKQNQEVVMRVQFSKNGAPFRPSRKVLWRGLALDHYDGRSWTATLPITWNTDHRPGRAVELFSIDPPEEMVHQEIYMESIDTPVVFTYGLPMWIDGSFRSLTMDANFALRTSDNHQGPRRFDMVTDIGQDKKGYALPLPMNLSEELRRRFLQLPRMSSEFRGLALDLAGLANTDLGRAEAVLRHFQNNFSYTLNMQRDTRMSAVDEFLFVRKAGHCEYFASAMVLLLRQLNIPARVVNGFIGAEWNQMGDYMIVRQAHAHSWVEAFFPGQGWKVFDPTPTDPGIAQNRPSRLSLYMDLMRLYWQRYVVKYNFGDQVRILRFFTRQTRSLSDGWQSWKNLKPREWFASLRNHPVLLGAVALGLATALWFTRRWWWPFGPASGPLPFAAVQYLRMLRRLERQGVIKHPGWTPQEFLDHLDDLPPEKRETVAQVTGLYQKTRFGGHPLDASERDSLQELVHQI